MFPLAFAEGTPPNSTEYQMFLSVLGELGRLVVLSMCLERALAFIFENPWYVFLAEKWKAKGYSDAWIKALLAFVGSFVVCKTYDFDVIATLFNKTPTAAPPTPFGVFLTALIAAGGSAGAISLFQGFLNISKDSRDAVIAANKADAEKLKADAEAAKYKAEIEAIKQKAEAEAAKKTDAERKVTDTDVALKKTTSDKETAAKKVADAAEAVKKAEAANNAANNAAKEATAKVLTAAQDEEKKAKDALAVAEKALTDADAANKAAIAARAKI